MQVAATVVPALHLPDAITSAVVLLVFLGFPIALILAWAFELTPEGIKRTEDVSPEASIKGRTWRKFVIAVGLVALAALALFVAQFERREKHPENAGADKSIAVLPFVDLSQGKDQEYFCDGISEEILDRLAKTEGLRVVARTSSFSFKGKTADVGEIAKKLGVQHLLEGSLRREGNRIRITAQLVNARDGFHIWSETFERDLQGVFAVQDEITQKIVEALQLKLAVAGPTHGQQNTEAYDLYLQGLYFSNKSSEEDLRKALTLFEAALEKDPQFARAWTGIAKTWLWLADAYVKPLDAYPAVKAAASKAIALDAREADAHCYLGEAERVLGWNYAAEQAQLEQALKIDPNSAPTHMFLALLLVGQGATEPALRHIEMARKADPLSPIVSNFAGIVLLSAGKIDQAIIEGKRTIELDPEYSYFESPLGAAYRAQGRLTDALAVYEKARDVSKQPTPGLAITYALLGRTAQARELVDQFIGQARTKYFAADSIAAIYVALGERDEAFRWLDRAVVEHSAPMEGLAVRPEFRPLYSDPRFADLLRRVGLDPFKALASTAKTAFANGDRVAEPVATKSIAVLPFENLSDDKQNAYFTDGVQDEILADLAKVADLKVISRTSVMLYKSGNPRNLREIGQQLGVAHVLEGSVQRSANRVRVTAQLIDAQSDAHLWAQTYDRDLADVFAIQSEIAKTIADQLQAKLSPSEKSAIEQAPTADVAAFDLYSRAKDLLLTAGRSGTGKADLLQAIDLLNQAVARDPSFSEAYCRLAYAHDSLYFFGHDHTSARLALAEAAIEAASRLRPNAGETHLARARNIYQGYFDYDGALAELELARQALPNDSRVFELMGYIQRGQQGRYEESTRTLERALELDPRNVVVLQQIAAFNYPRLRRYADAKSTWDRLLAITPDDVAAKADRAMVDFEWKGDTRPLHQTIDSIRATNPAAVQSNADLWLICALAGRDAAAANNASIACGENPINLASENVHFNRPFIEGVIARMSNDEAKARSAFTAARAEQEKIVQAQPNYGSALCVLGLIDAGLGRKEEALREGRRAVELLPVEKNAPHGADIVKYLAMTAAWVGDKDLACEQLAIAIRGPSNLSYGQLKLMPLWDPLRGDPRFEKIVADLAPKTGPKQ
jgi:TolB-like protein/Tfp pilus assembly protein PilF